MSRETIHEIKLREEFCDAVLCGDKNFEVRYNDRGYQKGDIIGFNPVDQCDLPISHPIEHVEFEITYVLSGWGIEQNYVVFGIKKHKTE